MNLALASSPVLLFAPPFPSRMPTDMDDKCMAPLGGLDGRRLAQQQPKLAAPAFLLSCHLLPAPARVDVDGVLFCPFAYSGTIFGAGES